MSKGYSSGVQSPVSDRPESPNKYSRPHSPDHYKRAQSPTKNGYQQSQLKNSHGLVVFMLDQHLQQNRLQDHYPLLNNLFNNQEITSWIHNGPVSPLSPVHRSIFASQSVPIEKISKPEW